MVRYECLQNTDKWSFILILNPFVVTVQWRSANTSFNSNTLSSHTVLVGRLFKDDRISFLLRSPSPPTIGEATWKPARAHAESPLRSLLSTAPMENLWRGPRTKRAAEGSTCGSGCPFTSTRRRIPIRQRSSNPSPRAQRAVGRVQGQVARAPGRRALVAPDARWQVARSLLMQAPRRCTTWWRQRSVSQQLPGRALLRPSARWATSPARRAAQTTTHRPCTRRPLHAAARPRARSWSRSAAWWRVSPPTSRSSTPWCCPPRRRPAHPVPLSARPTWSPKRSSCPLPWRLSRISSHCRPLRWPEELSRWQGRHLPRRLLQEPRLHQANPTWKSW